jgi:peptidyl-tRNA hydrolase ICT1
MASSADDPYAARNVVIPLDKLDFAFARSSGPGGQNVNKLNTKAEVRFNVYAADWLPHEVRMRLAEQQSNKINNDGELVVTSQEHRTQSKNKDDSIEKLRVMIAEAYIEPKERTMWEGISEKGKVVRKQEKRKRGEVKQARSNNKRFDYDD